MHIVDILNVYLIY